MFDPRAAEYIAGLPEVETARFPKGTLFYAQDRIYQVIETGSGGYHKAREWRQTEATDVALIPGSFPSKYLPLVKRGKLLPVYRTRLELTHDDQPTCFVFPTESLALDAAYLDVALIQKSGRLRAQPGPRSSLRRDGWCACLPVVLSTGSRRAAEKRICPVSRRGLCRYTPRPHTDGPGYWRLLSSWTEIIPDLDITQPMRPVQNSLAENDQTLPHYSDGQTSGDLKQIPPAT